MDIRAAVSVLKLYGFGTKNASAAALAVASPRREKPGPP
jgi:hypothetical protein